LIKPEGPTQIAGETARRWPIIGWESRKLSQGETHRGISSKGWMPTGGTTNGLLRKLTWSLEVARRRGDIAFQESTRLVRACPDQQPQHLQYKQEAQRVKRTSLSRRPFLKKNAVGGKSLTAAKDDTPPDLRRTSMILSKAAYSGVYPWNKVIRPPLGGQFNKD